jgi:arylsulfatase A-like enzyme
MSLSTSRPNILLIITDQQSASALGVAGNPWLSTPGMDQIARSGARFTNAACAWPKCVPSRTTLLYGRTPHNILLPGTEVDMGAKAGDPKRGVRPEYRDQELSRLLTPNGYECAYAGKWHARQWGPTESISPDDPLTAFRPLCPINDALTTQRCGEFFQDRKNDPRPFFLVASFDNPHNIHEWAIGNPLPWGNLPSPPALEELPLLPPNFAATPDEPVAVRARQRVIREQYDYSPEDWRRFRWAYFRLVEKVDIEVGRVLDALRESGLDKNTLVLFTSDHGDQHGSHQLAFKDILYDACVRVPLMACGAGVEVSGALFSNPVSSGPDIYATILDYAGVAAPEGVCGRSLRPFLEGRNPAERREYTVTEWTTAQGARGRMVRSERHEYVVYDRGPRAEQLFDLIEDPWELVNLAHSSKYAEPLQKHREYLRQYMRETGDCFMNKHYAHPEVDILLPGDEY